MSQKKLGWVDRKLLIEVLTSSHLHMKPMLIKKIKNSGSHPPIMSVWSRKLSTPLTSGAKLAPKITVFFLRGEG